MKYVRQVAIIWSFTMAGEILYTILPLPVPAGVYGLFLLLGALMAGWVRLESVEGTGNFLMDTMTMMFIPAMVGLMEYAAQIKEVFAPFMIVIVVSTVAVMAVTGRVAQTVINIQEHRRGRRTPERGWESAATGQEPTETGRENATGREPAETGRENTTGREPAEMNQEPTATGQKPAASQKEEHPHER